MERPTKKTKLSRYSQSYNVLNQLPSIIRPREFCRYIPLDGQHLTHFEDNKIVVEQVIRDNIIEVSVIDVKHISDTRLIIFPIHSSNNLVGVLWQNKTRVVYEQYDWKRKEMIYSKYVKIGDKTVGYIVNGWISFHWSHRTGFVIDWRDCTTLELSFYGDPVSLIENRSAVITGEYSITIFDGTKRVTTIRLKLKISKLHSASRNKLFVQFRDNSHAIIITDTEEVLFFQESLNVDQTIKVDDSHMIYLKRNTRDNCLSLYTVDLETGNDRLFSNIEGCIDQNADMDIDPNGQLLVCSTDLAKIRPKASIIQLKRQVARTQFMLFESLLSNLLSDIDVVYKH